MRRSNLILRSRAQHGVSKDGCTAGTRGHPSRRAQERAPQDEVRNIRASTFLLRVLLMAGFAAAVAPAFAQSKFPARPIRIVQPFAAGSVSDVSLRLMGDKLLARTGTQIVIDNQPRAGGITAATAVMAAPPDGYTVALFSSSTAISVSLFRHLPYDPVHDFAPVGGFTTFANIFATNINSRYRTLADIVMAARARPGALNVGTTTVGSTNHLAANLFKSVAGLDFVIVPYRGPPELLTAALRSDVDMIVQSFGALRPALLDRQLRPLASTTGERAAYMLDIPTVREGGVTGYEVISWNGFFVPAKTPKDIIAALNREFRGVLADEDLRGRFAVLGLEPTPSTPEWLGAQMASEIEKWARVVNDAGIEKQ
jgi:tripartite-type tricarboxylate transporter receptor subunit TctC